jgi:hypothetical protein
MDCLTSGDARGWVREGLDEPQARKGPSATALAAAGSL